MERLTLLAEPLPATSSHWLGLHGMQEARGSSPLSSTGKRTKSIFCSQAVSWSGSHPADEVPGRARAETASAWWCTPDTAGPQRDHCPPARGSARPVAGWQAELGRLDAAAVITAPGQPNP